MSYLNRIKLYGGILSIKHINTILKAFGEPKYLDYEQIYVYNTLLDLKKEKMKENKQKKLNNKK